MDGGLKQLSFSWSNKEHINGPVGGDRKTGDVGNNVTYLAPN